MRRLALLSLLFTTSIATAQPRTMGIGTHFAQNDGLPAQDLPYIANLGFNAHRDEIYWRLLETTKGELNIPPSFDTSIDAALKAKVAPLLALCYGNKLYDDGAFPTSPEAIEAFCRYAEHVARHYNGKVHTYEIWNEWDLGLGVPKQPNGKRTKGQPADYVRLVKAVYPRLKAIDPNLTIIAGATADSGTRDGQLVETIRLGLNDFCDAISFHPYVRPAPPEICLRDSSRAIDQMKAALAEVSPGANLKPVQITEIGWPTETIGPRSVSPATQADYLARTYLLFAAHPDVAGIYWFNFQHAGVGKLHGDGESLYGIVYPDLTPTPAASITPSIAQIYKEAKFIKRLNTHNENVTALLFQHNQDDLIATWSTAPDDNWQLTLKASTNTSALSTGNGSAPALSTGSAFSPLSIQIGSRPPYPRDWIDRTRTKDKLTAELPHQLSITLRATPTLLRGKLPENLTLSVTHIPYPELSRPSPTTKPAP